MLETNQDQYTTVDWPPTYTLKKNKRARRVIFKVSLEKGLEIVTPYRFSVKHIPQLLEEKRSWIEKQLRRNQQQLQTAELKPTEFALQAIEETWTIHYTPTTASNLKLIINANKDIHLIGDISNPKITMPY